MLDLGNKIKCTLSQFFRISNLSRIPSESVEERRDQGLSESVVKYCMVRIQTLVSGIWQSLKCISYKVKKCQPKTKIMRTAVQPQPLSLLTFLDLGLTPKKIFF